MEENCCMKDCANNSQNEILYSFPTNINLCMLWVQNCGKLEFFEDFAYLGACAFVNRRICTAHFKSADFMDPENKSSGLNDNAVPLANFQLIIAENCTENQNQLHNLEVDPFLSVKPEPTEDEDSCGILNPDQIQAGIEPLLKVANIKAFDAYPELKKRREKLLVKEANLRKEKNAVRAAVKRQNETPEQRADRKLKDIIRSARRRESETELQRQIRRYNDAVRAAYRRSTETEEQKLKRRTIDVLRAAKRRNSETPEQRENRLQGDRLRAAKRRLLKRIGESGSELSCDSTYSNNFTLFNEKHNELLESLNNTEVSVECEQSENIHHFSSVNPKEAHIDKIKQEIVEDGNDAILQDQAEMVFC